MKSYKMSVYAFSIITNNPTGWHSYPGELRLFNLIPMFNAIQKHVPFSKLRFHTRKPIEEDVRIAYSSIALFLPTNIESFLIVDNIKQVFKEFAPLYENHDYVLTPMEKSNEIAFVLWDGVHDISKNSKFHNEWFSMPIGSDDLKDSGLKDYNNLIYEYTNVETPMKVFKGNTTKKTWLVQKYFKNGVDTYATNILNSGIVDGIFDGTNEKIIHNPISDNPLEKLYAPKDSAPPIAQASLIANYIKKTILENRRRVEVILFENDMFTENKTYLEKNGFKVANITVMHNQCFDGVSVTKGFLYVISW